MLEAVMRLLEQGEIGALTTNAVAARAGISIGTLYQYFDDKEALLDALVERELGAMSAAILDIAKDTSCDAPGDRIRRVMRAVVSAYGGRSRVHRRLIAHAALRRPGSRLSPLYAQLTETFVSQGVAVPGEQPKPLSQAQAFVLTHALAGVLHALAARDDPPPLREIEDALVQLATAYVATIRGSRGVSPDA